MRPTGQRPPQVPLVSGGAVAMIRVTNRRVSVRLTQVLTVHRFAWSPPSVVGDQTVPVDENLRRLGIVVLASSCWHRRSSALRLVAVTQPEAKTALRQPRSPGDGPPKSVR